MTMRTGATATWDYLASVPNNIAVVDRHIVRPIYRSISPLLLSVVVWQSVCATIVGQSRVRRTEELPVSVRSPLGLRRWTLADVPDAGTLLINYPIKSDVRELRTALGNVSVGEWESCRWLVSEGSYRSTVLPLHCNRRNSHDSYNQMSNRKTKVCL